MEPIMTNFDISSTFDLLDNWRHLPSYQLERRADIFFALFLPNVLNHALKCCDVKVNPYLIPEFPLRTGTGTTKHSFKIDYFALSCDGENAFLIELKTDLNWCKDKTRMNDQLTYLKGAVERGTLGLLSDVKCMAKAKDRAARQKYFHLICALVRLGLFEAPSDDLRTKMYADRSTGVFKYIDSIEFAEKLPSLKTILVLPKCIEGWFCINFKTVAEVVEDQGEIGKRFASSLRQWSRSPAGSDPGSEAK